MSPTLQIALIMIGCIALICVVLVAIHKREKKNRELHQLHLFNQVITANDITVSNKERFKDRVIALDAGKKIVVFLDFEQTEKAAVIDLKKAGGCFIVKDSGISYYKEKNKSTPSMINSVALEVASHREESLGRFVFFDHIRDNMMDMIRLTNRAEHWKKLISQAVGK
jgi:hypothetical protein